MNLSFPGLDIDRNKVPEIAILQFNLRVFMSTQTQKPRAFGSVHQAGFA
jgi:hypothetical protein